MEQIASYCDVGTWSLYVTDSGAFSKVVIVGLLPHQVSSIESPFLTLVVSICISSRWESDDRSQMAWFSGESLCPFLFVERGAASKCLNISWAVGFSQRLWSWAPGRWACSPPWQVPAVCPSLCRHPAGQPAPSALSLHRYTHLLWPLSLGVNMICVSLPFEARVPTG